MKKHFVGLLLLFYFLVALAVIWYYDGTGDSGDSVLHYLYAKYAPVQTELYFDHWAKPVFVLLASPFAQFGFAGMKLFNVLVSILTLFLTYKIAVKLDFENPVLAVVFSIFAPLSFVLTFSGLTEPLFALFLAAGIYAALCERAVLGSLIISFLPFVRSEGLIIIGVFGFFLLLKRNWKALPVLAVGHVVYSIAGWFVFNELLWVFTRIPYGRLSSNYGSGPLSHFVVQLINITGVPVYFMFWAGVIAGLITFFRRRKLSDYFVLIYTMFFAYFIAHSLFWYLGIFNSMGLKRVLIGVLPLISLIALAGFNSLTNLIPSEKIKRPVRVLSVAYVVIFPFTPNPAAVKVNSDLTLAADQKAIQEVADFIRENEGLRHRFVFNHPYISQALGINHFDYNRHIGLRKEYLDRTEARDIIVWDSWFSVTEEHLSKEEMTGRTDLEMIFEIQKEGRKGTAEFLVFRKKQTK